MSHTALLRSRPRNGQIFRVEKKRRPKEHPLSIKREDVVQFIRKSRRSEENRQFSAALESIDHAIVLAEEIAHEHDRSSLLSRLTTRKRNLTKKIKYKERKAALNFSFPALNDSIESPSFA